MNIKQLLAAIIISSLPFTAIAADTFQVDADYPVTSEGAKTSVNFSSMISKTDSNTEKGVYLLHTEISSGELSIKMFGSGSLNDFTLNVITNKCQQSKKINLDQQSLNVCGLDLIISELS